MRLDSFPGALTQNVFNEYINPFVATYPGALEPPSPELFITTQNGIDITTENGNYLTTE